MAQKSNIPNLHLRNLRLGEGGPRKPALFCVIAMEWAGPLYPRTARTNTHTSNKINVEYEYNK